MKRIISLTLIALLGVITLMAQDAPKKKGGFWNKVKKGVESATGIDVSREALFVYPKLGEWKMSLKSAVGNPETGNVTVIFNVMPLAGQRGGALKMAKIIGGDDVELIPDKQWEYGSNVHDLYPDTFTEYKLRRITVSPDMRYLKSICFTIGNQEGFEARDVAIDWQRTE